MRRRFLAVSAALSLLVIAACGPDVVAPRNGQTPDGKTLQPGPAAAAATCDPAYTAAAITTDLGVLMAVLTPNNQSAQSKWEYVQLLMSYNTAESTAEAQAYAQSPLISFITLKYDQASAATKAQYAALFAKVTAGITCFTTTVFDIPENNQGVALALPDGAGGAFFPSDFCDKEAGCGGINVTFEKVPKCISAGVPAGCISKALNTLLDQYGDYMRIVTTGGNPNFTNPVIVALCLPSDAPADVLVGHQETDILGPNGFSVLNLADIPEALDDLLPCTDNPTNLGNNTPENAPKNMFARFVHRIADLLLPEKASARSYYMATLGVGGTTRKFSPFGLVSPTLSATGGIGGSKSSFSPANPDAPARAPSLTTLADGTGNLQDSINVVQTTGLPKVLVTTGKGVAIPGATVTFKALAPTNPSFSYEDDPSHAQVCKIIDVDSGLDTVTVDAGIAIETDGFGFAELNCLNFGDELGYMDLAATVDPSTANLDPTSDADEVYNIKVAACTSPSSCDAAAGTTTLHWLVRTVIGPPAQLTVTTPGGEPGGAQLGKKLAEQPVATVKDASNNPVSGVTVTVALTNGGGILGCYTETDCTSATTGPDGKATFINLVITGNFVASGQFLPTPQTLRFTSGGKTAETTVTPTVGAPSSLTIDPELGQEPNGSRIGEKLNKQPAVTVLDADGNPIKDSLVTVALTGGDVLGCFNPPAATPDICKSATTGPDGKATFDNLVITGTVLTEQTLTFELATGLKNTAPVTPVVGYAYALNVAPDDLGAPVLPATLSAVATVKDISGNPVSASVGVSISGGATLCGGSSCPNADTDGTTGNAAFSSLSVAGNKQAGNLQTLTFTTPGRPNSTLSATATFRPQAGVASKIVPNTPLSGVYPTTVDPFTVLVPQVLVTDALDNPVSGSVFWAVNAPANGARVPASPDNQTTAPSSGLTSISWTLGDGGNGLKAYLGTSATGTPATFSATTNAFTSGTQLAACPTSGTIKKTDLAQYSATLNGYRGYVSINAAAKGLVRKLLVDMSVTGQSSGTGNYVSTANVYRLETNGSRGALVATGKPNNGIAGDSTLKLPGNNSSPTVKTFTMTPSGVVGPTGRVLVEVLITAPSTRTFQIWYNTKTTAGTGCDNSWEHPLASTPSSLFTTPLFRGVHMTITN